jgi:hypothetical protein
MPIHPTAIIDPTACIDEDVTIDSFNYNTLGGGVVLDPQPVWAGFSSPMPWLPLNPPLPPLWPSLR